MLTIYGPFFLQPKRTLVADFVICITSPRSSSPSTNELG
jgi:hypothetical protein